MNNTHKQPEHIKAKLETMILKGLSLEWEYTADLLDKTYHSILFKPLFSIRDLKDMLGYWSQSRYEICLSRNLVLNHSWDSVVDVLRHEMAHQLVAVMNMSDETPHGPMFQQACRMLRADPRASGSNIPLDQRISSENNASQDKILIKVKKLLALAESQNQHEAEAAMIKAHELITRHQLDILQQQQHQDFNSIFLGQPRLKHFRDEYELANLILRFYFVEGLWTPAYIIAKGKMGRVLEISGTPRNLKLAEYVYHFVSNHIDMQWRTYSSGKKLNRHRKTDFSIGIIQGFRSKLDEGGKHGKFSARQTALIKSGDPELKQYFQHRYPKVIHFYRDTLGRDEKIYQDGVKIGKSMVISQGISQQTESGKLLEYKVC